MLLGSNLEPHWLKRTDWQKTWFELLWHRETCSYLARAPPAGHGAELRLLVPLQTACRSLWIRPARGKELWQSKSLVKHTMGAKGPVIAVTAQSHNLCPVTVLCSQINSKQAEKNEYDPDCCFACRFRKLGRMGGTRRESPVKRFSNHSHIQCIITERNLDYPFKGKSLLWHS